MFIDSNTTKAELLAAVNSDIDLVDAFIKAGLDEGTVSEDDLREFICNWIAEGDEFTAA